MAKKYKSPVLLSDIGGLTGESGAYAVEDSIREQKDDLLATSFVYGDESYEEEYIVPDVMEEIAAPAEAEDITE